MSLVGEMYEEGVRDGFNKGIDAFTEELKKRLPDALKGNDIISVTNLMDEIHRELAQHPKYN